jgi:hypothetical protein
MIWAADYLRQGNIVLTLLIDTSRGHSLPPNYLPEPEQSRAAARFPRD